MKKLRVGVNLPRWGLKHILALIVGLRRLCKFTPLGFETSKQRQPS